MDAPSHHTDVPHPGPVETDLLVAVPVMAPEAVAPERERPVLPWIFAGAALLLAALLAGALAAFVFAGADEDATARAPAPAATSTETVRTTSGSGRPARLTAGGEDLLATDARSLGFWVGDDAKGEGLRVLSVVGSRGLVIGTGENDRVYVEFGEGVGEDEPGAMPDVGDTIDFSGPLKAAPLEPEKALDISGEAAEIVREREAYVNADRVVPSARG